MSNYITIEPISHDYHDQFKQLGLESFKNEPTAFLVTYEEESKISDEKWKERIDASIEGKIGVTLVARDGDKLVGRIGLSYQKYEKVKHIAHIWGTYVIPEHRGKGIGKLLLQKIIEQAKSKPEIKKIKIEVNPSQVAAYELYKKLGFIEIGTAKMELYVNGTFHDAVQMEMYL